MHMLRPLIAAFFFCTAVSAPAWAVVATTAVPCVTAWTDLGIGPMIVQASSSCVIAVADVTPGASLVGFHLGSSVPYNYSGTSRLWVRGSGVAVIAK